MSREEEERIETAARSDSSHWNGTVLADVKFDDDACFTFEANNPAALVCKASDLLQIVDEVCEAHGLIVNMSDGKTECTIEMKGEGAREQFERLWDQSKKSHRISSSTGRSARIVSRQHVGRIRNKTQNPIDDAEAKANKPSHSVSPAGPL